MIDSCSPRKLDPGFEQTYSIPSDLITSTMKSEPERLSVNTSSFAGSPISASGGTGVGGTLRASSSCARTAVGVAASAAAPTAALFRNARRSIGSAELFFREPSLSLRTVAPPHHLSVLYHSPARPARDGRKSMSRWAGKQG